MRGYSRAEVDTFLQAAARERARFEADIADANRRIREARTAIGVHGVMVSMVLEAQRELAGIRRAAEVEADRIVSAAEADAQHVLAGARSDGASPGPAPVVPGASVVAPPARSAPPASGPEPLVDLVDRPAPNGSSDRRVHAGGARPDALDTDYFEFLRGALADDQPLGPHSE